LGAWIEETGIWDRSVVKKEAYQERSWAMGLGRVSERERKAAERRSGWVGWG